MPFYGVEMNTRTAFHPFQGIPGENLIPPTTTFSFTNNQGNQPGPGFCARKARLFRVGHFTGNRRNLSAFLAEKMPEQKNRPGIEHYSLFKNNSAAAPITAKETEPSKLTTKSALTDNSLNTIRSRNSRIVSRAFTTNLLVQGLGACPRRIEPCVFLPLRKLEDFISKGASTFLSESILHRKTKALNPTLFSLSKEEKPCVA